MVRSISIDLFQCGRLHQITQDETAVRVQARLMNPKDSECPASRSRVSPLAINQLSRSLRSPLTKPQIDQPSTDKPSVASVDPIVGSPHPAPRRRTTRTRARSSDDLAPGGPYLSVRRWPAAGGLDRGGASRKARPRLPAFFGLGAVGACASDQWPRPPAIIGGGGRVESAPPHLARLCFCFRPHAYAPPGPSCCCCA